MRCGLHVDSRHIYKGEKMFNAILFGATGYTGVELTRLLSGHPEIRISVGTSRQWAGKMASDVFPFILDESDFPIVTTEHGLDYKNIDVAFLALPHGGAAQVAKPLVESGVKIIDLSADFRLKDLNVYKQWYGEHKAPEILNDAVYGLPEIHRRKIESANLIANPGCYPTSVILGLAPLITSDLVNVTRPIVDSKSAISGAGRGPKLNTSFCESGEGFKPYAVTGHRHIPEMEQELSQLAHRDVKVRFTPHLMPAIRGMLSDIYLETNEGVSDSQLRELFREYYNEAKFVKVLKKGQYPDTAMTRGANLCLISVEKDERTGIALIMSAIDNLVKGASGQAVQNMNIVLGLDETMGLGQAPFFP